MTAPLPVWSAKLSMIGPWLVLRWGTFVFKSGWNNNGWDNQKTSNSLVNFYEISFNREFEFVVIKRDKKELRLGFRVGLPGVVLIFLSFLYLFFVSSILGGVFLFIYYIITVLFDLIPPRLLFYLSIYIQ
jgi:hypothetical protein